MLDSWKHRLAERSKQNELRRTGGTPESASFHRAAYHRHFEGYTEVKRIDARGRTVIERVYTGKYYEPELDRFRRLTLRFFYLLFFVGGAALFIFSATRNTLCNSAPYVNLFQALSVPLLLWCVYVLLFYIPSTGKLTIGEYNSQHKSLIRAALLTAICMWMTGLGALVCLFLRFGEETLTGLLCTAGFTISGLFLFLIYFFESHLNYIVSNSDTASPEDGVEIE